MRKFISTNTPILKDFLTFLTFCENEKPKITPTREYLTRAACHQLNQQLEIPATDVNPRNDQHFYIPIHFYFQLAVESDLFRIDRSKKTAFRLAPHGEKIKAYRALSPAGQYLFLLKTYWVHCDWAIMGNPDGRRISTPAGDKGLETLAELEAGKTYKKSKYPDVLQIFNWMLNEHVLYWELLGWIKVRRQIDKKFGSKSWLYFDEITVTEFGKQMVDLLLEERMLTDWNEPYHISGPSPLDFGFAALFGDEEEDDDDEEDLDLGLPELPENPTKEDILEQFKMIQDQMKEAFGAEVDLISFLKKSAERGEEPSLEELQEYLEEQILTGLAEQEEEPFEQAFLKYFPDEKIPLLIIKDPVEFIEGQFIFKVSLKYEPKIWRTVALDAHHTMADLHLIIQRAFNFDNDHLYCFYMDKRNRFVLNDSRGGMGGNLAMDYEIGELEWTPNKRITYHFDFGDDWEFNVDFLEHKTGGKPLKKAKILEKQGKAPEQYPEWEEEW